MHVQTLHTFLQVTLLCASGDPGEETVPAEVATKNPREHLLAFSHVSACSVQSTDITSYFQAVLFICVLC